MNDSLRLASPEALGAEETRRRQTKQSPSGPPRASPGYYKGQSCSSQSALNPEQRRSGEALPRVHVIQKIGIAYILRGKR